MIESSAPKRLPDARRDPLGPRNPPPETTVRINARFSQDPPSCSR